MIIALKVLKQMEWCQNLLSTPRIRCICQKSPCTTPMSVFNVVYCYYFCWNNMFKPNVSRHKQMLCKIKIYFIDKNRPTQTVEKKTQFMSKQTPLNKVKRK